jgi:hypothetical protein
MIMNEDEKEVQEAIKLTKLLHEYIKSSITPENVHILARVLVTYIIEIFSSYHIPKSEMLATISKQYDGYQKHSEIFDMAKKFMTKEDDDAIR